MKHKKLLSLIAAALLSTFTLIANDNSPVGKWSKDKIGSSDYYLEITDSEIKYIDKKTEGYITWNYSLSDDSICFGDIIDSSTKTLNHELYTPLYKNNNKTVKFSRKDSKMTLTLADTEVKFILTETKHKIGKVAAGIGTVAAVVATAAIVNEVTDTVASSHEVNSLADKVYSAAW